MFVNGKWVQSQAGETSTILNPATEEELALVPMADESDAAVAVNDARRAFSEWRWVTGLERAEMEARLDRIVAFAELGGFIDHPVKSYSTGMAMRLAFAVATHVDPDVLAAIVDQVHASAVGVG